MRPNPKGLSTTAVNTPSLAARPDAHLLGGRAPRLSNTSLVAIPGEDGSRLARALSDRGVYVATGSACQAGATEPSHVLRAMRLPAAVAAAAVRFSFAVRDAAPIGHAAAHHLLAVLRDSRALRP